MSSYCKNICNDCHKHTKRFKAVTFIYLFYAHLLDSQASWQTVRDRWDFPQSLLKNKYKTQRVAQIKNIQRLIM